MAGSSIDLIKSLESFGAFRVRKGKYQERKVEDFRSLVFFGEPADEHIMSEWTLSG
jgi:hypothetical protein